LSRCVWESLKTFLQGVMKSQTPTQSEFATNDFRISYRLYGFSTSGL
jgi:hypothetical protein